jgi:hypothetical protein
LLTACTALRTVSDPGAFSAGDTLVPIPNTKVKTRCGDDTPMGESSTVPDYSKTCRKAGFWRLGAKNLTELRDHITFANSLSISGKAQLLLVSGAYVIVGRIVCLRTLAGL